MSAFFSSVSASIPSIGATEMPMLAPMTIWLSSMSIGSAIELDDPFGDDDGLLAAASSGPTITANSSPPSRATMSVSRAASRSRLATIVSTLVPDGMPERVVDRLEVVEIDAQHRHASRRA